MPNKILSPHPRIRIGSLLFVTSYNFFQINSCSVYTERRMSKNILTSENWQGSRSTSSSYLLLHSPTPLTRVVIHKVMTTFEIANRNSSTDEHRNQQQNSFNHEFWLRPTDPFPTSLSSKASPTFLVFMASHNVIPPSWFLPFVDGAQQFWLHLHSVKNFFS